MRPYVPLGILTVVAVIVSFPVHGQDPPVNAPDVPVDAPSVPSVEPPTDTDFIGSYQGTLYYVRDGVVERLDGVPVEDAAARQVLLAQRASDLLNADPGFVERLAAREAYARDLQDRIAMAEEAVERVRSVADALDAETLTGTLLGRVHGLGVYPAELEAGADAVEDRLAQARGQAEAVEAASAETRRAVEAFAASHSVEDKVAMFDAFTRAIPVYQEAAAQAADLQARAEAVAARAEDAAGRLAAEGKGLAFGLSVPRSVPTDLDAATGGFLATAAHAQSLAEDLKGDAAFMQAILAEPVTGSFPVAWVVGGGSAAAATGLGTLWWLRRRIGLP